MKFHSNTAHKEDKTDIEKYNKFFNQGKWLSKYALACGYIEHIAFQKINPSMFDIILTLEHNGGIGYDVKAYNHTTGIRIQWETFERLSDARRNFTALKNKIVKGSM